LSAYGEILACNRLILALFCGPDLHAPLATFGRLTPFSPPLAAQNGPSGLSFSESFRRPPIRPKVENPVFMRVFRASISSGFACPARDSDTLTSWHFELPPDGYLWSHPTNHSLAVSIPSRSRTRRVRNVIPLGEAALAGLAPPGHAGAQQCMSVRAG
jgi:hypothetical protein